MTGHDDELEDFLRRRKPLFRPAEDDVLEPPAELDRIVLRQAREAIAPARPQRVFRAPRWSAPVALAATLVLAFTIILRVGLTDRPAATSEVTVQKASRQVEPRPLAERMESAAPAPVAAAEPNYSAAADAAADSGAVVVDLGDARHELARDLPEQRARAAAPAPLVAEAEARRYAEPPPAAPQLPAAPPVSNRSLADSGLVSMQASGGDSIASDAAPGPTAKAAAETQPWRRDAKSWMAEIERLRETGDVTRADAELAEFKRQHRAYAGAPDR